MSDEQENIEQEIDLEALANTEDPTQEDQQEEVQLSDFEQKQYDEGWRPLDDFNGPEENWKTAKEFQRHGEMISQINSIKHQMDSQKKDFDVRMSNNNKLHEARRKSEITQLREQQRDAVDSQDTEAFDKAQTQIEALEKSPVQDKPVDTQTKDPDMAAWEVKNPWINEPGNDKGIYAQGVWNNYLANNPQATTQQALTHVDSKVASVFPSNNDNPRRNQPNTTENNTRRSTRQSKNLTMSDLTSNERQEWNTFGSLMFTETEFLKTVADTRKG